MSLDCFGGFLNQITTKKKVQLSGHWLQCQIVLVGSSQCFLAGSSIKLQITTKKKVQLSGHQLECCLYLKQGFLNQITNYDRKEKVQSALLLQYCLHHLQHT